MQKGPAADQRSDLLRDLDDLAALLAELDPSSAARLALQVAPAGMRNTG